MSLWDILNHAMIIDLIAELNRFAPYFAANTTTRLQIPWNIARGVEIVITEASDNDTGPDSSRIRYSLTASPYTLPFGVSNGLGIFAIDPMSGLISFSSDLPFDPERATQFLLTIRASDLGKPSLFALHTLNLVPVPSLVLRDLTGKLRINEELPLGTVIAQLSCVEIGPPSYTTLITLRGQASTAFTIAGRSDLEVAERIDYESLSESEREFNLTATCTNRYKQTDSITITVVVNNVNDNVFQFRHPRHTLLVSENVTASEEVLMVLATDRDSPNANITYSLEASVNDFAIVPYTGQIVIHSSLDRETQALYEFTVHAAYTNMSGLVEATSSMVTIHIADVNDESPIFEESSYNITASNELGDLVVVVSATDSDEGSNGEVTYHLLERIPEFEINETTGAIYIGSFLTSPLYVLNITATDGGEDPRSSLALLYIYVSIALRQTLQVLAEDLVTVEENIPVGSVISNVSYSVQDDSNAALEVVFELVNGSASDVFGINETTGEIYTTGSLDFENLATEYDLTVRATLFAPLHELVDETVVRIEVENVDDTPPEFPMSFYVTSVEQFTVPNITILTITAVDQDALNNTEYLLSGENSSIFQIDSFTGEISATVVLDFPQDYRFTVVAMDSGTGEAAANVFISVFEIPIFIAEEFIFSVSENALPGTIIGKIAYGFMDATGEIDFRVVTPDALYFNATYTVSVNISEDIFHIDSASGNISTLDVVVDFENRGEYVFNVEMYNVITEVVY